MAVYTEVDDSELAAFMSGYGLGELLSCKGIAEGVENSNFLVTMETGPFILTLYEKRVDPADLPFFLDLMAHLSATGVPCPLPVTANGEQLRTLANRPAAVFTFLPGMSARRPNVPNCRGIGEALAMMHTASQSFEGQRKNALGVADWRALLDASGYQADNVKPGMFEALQTELELLETSWPNDLPHGVIHADLFPDNVFFRGPHVSGLIDFYFACNDFLAYDIAICLNAWCFESRR